MKTGTVMLGKPEAGVMVCTPEPGMLIAMRCVVPAGGGFALESKIAWRNDPPPLSVVLVTVKVIAGVGVGVVSGDSVASPAPGPPRCDFSHRFWPNPASAREAPVKQHATPIKTCRLRNPPSPTSLRVKLRRVERRRRAGADSVTGFFSIFTMYRASALDRFILRTSLF